MKPRILDLYCGAGGAAMGYHRAGFEVIGVDYVEQPNYPFEFHEADAVEVLESMAATFRRWVPEGRPVLRLDNFDAIHASPPCQAYSSLNAYNKREYPDLIAGIRFQLDLAGLPYVIENVEGAPLDCPVTLCGASFGLRVYRHRLFETNFPLMVPGHGRHEATCARNGVIPPEDGFFTVTGGKHSAAWLRAAAEAMDVGWMTDMREVCEAIPPAYTEHIGSYLQQHLAQPVELAS